MCKNYVTRLLALATALSILAGCAGMGVGGTPEEQVRKLATARIDALMVGDFEKSFSYVAPALRESTDWQDHAMRYAGIRSWTNAEVAEVDCEESRCQVKVLVTYKIPRYEAQNTRPLKEVWIAVDGRWYLYYD